MFEDELTLVFDGDARFGKRRIVHGIKCFEFLRIVFFGPVAAEKLVIEKDAYLWHQRLIPPPGRSNFKGRYNVLTGIGTDLANR